MCAPVSTATDASMDLISYCDVLRWHCSLLNFSPLLDVSKHVADHKTQKGMLCPDLLALRVNHSHSAHRYDIALPGASQLLFYSSNKNRVGRIGSLDRCNIHKC